MTMQALKQQMEHKQIETLIRAQGRTPMPGMRIFQDSTDFMKLDSGDILGLGDKPFFIIRNEKEVGFGMDGDPKYWVKKTINWHPSFVPPWGSSYQITDPAERCSASCAREAKVFQWVCKPF